MSVHVPSIYTGHQKTNCVIRLCMLVVSPKQLWNAITRCVFSNLKCPFVDVPCFTKDVLFDGLFVDKHVRTQVPQVPHNQDCVPIHELTHKENSLVGAQTLKHFKLLLFLLAVVLEWIRFSLQGLQNNYLGENDN